MKTKIIQAAIVIPGKVEIKLARVIEQTPFAKKFHSEGMADKVRRAVNRWMYESTTP
jgi:hypothetical protein